MRRVLLAAAAATIPFAGLVIGLSSPASAGGGKITCTTITGTVGAGNNKISGCSGGDTGGSSLTFSGLQSGATIPWTSGSSTTLGTVSYAEPSPKKCPGYSKGASKEPTAVKFTATVTHDSGDGIKTPGKAKGEICLSTTNQISAIKPFVIS